MTFDDFLQSEVEVAHPPETVPPSDPPTELYDKIEQLPDPSLCRDGAEIELNRDDPRWPDESRRTHEY